MATSAAERWPAPMPNQATLQRSLVTWAPRTCSTRRPRTTLWPTPIRSSATIKLSAPPSARDGFPSKPFLPKSNRPCGKPPFARLLLSRPLLQGRQQVVYQLVIRFGRVHELKLGLRNGRVAQDRRMV